MRVQRGKKKWVEEELCFLPAFKLREMMRRKALSPVEVVRALHPFPAIGYGLIVSLGLPVIVNPFTKPEPDEHPNRVFGKLPARE